MNKINFDLKMQNLIEGLKNQGKKPKLLLHSCCAPCSSSCIERLKDNFELIIYYYNPNMDSEEEFNLRAKEQERLAKEFNLECIVEKYDSEEFYSSVSGLEQEKEGSARCEKCFYLRLKKTVRKAKELDCEFFSTTLTVSPLKSADKINKIGMEIEKEEGVLFLPSDFKKKGGYLRSIELSKQYNLYRQNYCGCKFSKYR